MSKLLKEKYMQMGSRLEFIQRILKMNLFL